MLTPSPSFEPAVFSKIIKEWPNLKCDEVVIMGLRYYSFAPELYRDKNVIKIFNVNIIDNISYTLNPEHNERRSPLVMFGCKR